MIIPIIVFIMIIGFSNSSSAQVRKIQIHVNGLACPFCAYGLEKELKKLDGVEKVSIALNDGLAVLDHKKLDSLPALLGNAAMSVNVKGIIVQEENAKDSGKPLTLNMTELLE